MENLSPLDHREEEDPPGTLITEQKDELIDSKIDLNIKQEEEEEISDIKTEESQDEEINEVVENLQETADLMALKTTIKIQKPIAVNPSNGGKPMMSTINKNKTKQRGRPKRKALTAMYQSQISDTLGIKLCIKKSETPQKTKSNKKRSRRKVKDSDDSDCDRKRRRDTIKQKANNNTDKSVEPVEQSVWGKNIPENCLYEIFKKVVHEEGSLPALFRLGRVCSLWRNISLKHSLWKNLDLTTWMKEKHRNELKLKWFIDHRLKDCTDLNLANYKITNIQVVLDKLLESCPSLAGINLANWKGFTGDQLLFLTEEFKSLQRLDLSAINVMPRLTTNLNRNNRKFFTKQVETSASKTAVGLNPLCSSLQAMNSRLTHLYLAHNRLAGIPQLITTISTHCPNLVVLDLSNVSTVAMSHGILHIEKLQIGCPKLRILLVTNSHITLSTATLEEQNESPGFPDLEELSVASLADESRLINDDFLQRILKTSTKLKLLDVRGCARLKHDSLIRLPTWDLKHLYLSGCSVTRDLGSGLELIASKWAHSLTDIDFAWANVQEPLDNALKALAEKGKESPLSHLSLCGSSVSLDAVKEVLINCPNINSINLSSCRGLPRGVKRLLQGSTEIAELRENLGAPLKITAPTV